jgi:hypothetical protein
MPAPRADVCVIAVVMSVSPRLLSGRFALARIGILGGLAHPSKVRAATFAIL